MRTVTALEAQKRNKERVNIYLDGEFAFGLNLLDAARLQRGQQLSDVEVDELLARDAVVKAIDQAIHFLSYRPRSSQEVRQHLSRKDIPEGVINDAIAKLQEQGYVDDHSFARFWIQNRSAFKPRGAQALRYELRQKGVGSSIIDQTLDEHLDETHAAYEAARARARRFRGSTRSVFRQKLGAFLQRRGFGYDTCRECLGRLQDELEAEDDGFFLDE